MKETWKDILKDRMIERNMKDWFCFATSINYGESLFVSGKRSARPGGLEDPGCLGARFYQNSQLAPAFICQQILTFID